MDLVEFGFKPFTRLLVVLGTIVLFAYSTLTEMTLSDTLRYIGNEAFYDSMLMEITIPTSVESIGDGAFEACGVPRHATVSDHHR